MREADLGGVGLKEVGLTIDGKSNKVPHGWLKYRSEDSITSESPVSNELPAPLVVKTTNEFRLQFEREPTIIG